MKKGLPKKNKQLDAQNRERQSKIDEIDRAHCEGLLNSMADALVVVDPEGKVIICNEAYLGMVGAKKDEVVGVSIKESVSTLGLARPDELEIGLSKLEQSRSDAQPGNYEMPIFTRSGEPRTLSISSSMVRIPEGRPSMILLMMRDITERKQMEKALQESNQQLSEQNEELRAVEEALKLGVIEIDKARVYSEGLLGSMSDALAVIDVNGTLIDVNDAYLKMLGFSKREDVVGLPALQVMSEVADAVEVEKAYASIQEAVAGQPVGHKEMTFTLKNGTTVITSTSTSVVKNTAGDPLLMFGVLRDITEDKMIEQALQENEEKHRHLFDTMAQGVIYQNTAGEITSINPAGERIIGLTLDQMKGLTPIDPRWKTLHEDGSDFPRETHPASVSLQTGKPANDVIMGVFHPADGQYHWISISAVPQFKPGEDKPYQAYTTFTDITERKRAEEALRENERFVTSTLNDLITYAAVLKPDGEIIFSNNTGLKLIGKSIEQVRGMKFYDMDWWAYSQDAQRLIKGDLERCASGEKVFREVQVYTLNGNIWIDFSIHPVFGENGDVKYLIPEGRDVTESKRVRDALRESEEKHRHLFDTMAQGVVYHDSTGKITSANPAAERIIGLTLDQMQGRTPIDPGWKTLHEDGTDFPGATHPATVSRRTGKPVNNVIMGVFNPADEQYHWISVSAVPQFNPGEDKPCQVYTTFTDITERKRMEQELAEKNRQLDLKNADLQLRIDEISKARAYSVNLLSNMVDGFVVVDMKGTLIDVNDAYLKMLGFSKREEVVGLPAIQVMSMVAEPSEVEKAAVALQEIIAGKEGILGEMAFTPRGGSPILVSSSNSLIRDAAGAPMFTFGVLRDITERKQMEDTLRKSEKQLREVSSKLPGIVFQFYARSDGKMGLYYVSDQAEQIFGLKPNLLMFFEDFADAVLPEYRDSFLKSIEKAVREVTQWRFDGALRKPSGEIKWFSGNSTPDQREDEVVFNGVILDITERKLAEAQLKESENLYSSMANNSQVGVYIVQDGKFVFVNPQFQKNTGFTEEELLGKHPLELVHPADKEVVRGKVIETLKGESGSSYEYRLTTKDGEPRVFLETISSIQYNGKRAALVSQMDITERKRAEEVQEKAASEWSATFDSITDLISVQDKDFRLVRVNKAYAEAFKTSPGELVGKVCHQIVHKTDKPCHNCPHQRTLVTQKTERLELFEPTMGIYLDISTAPLFDDKGDVIGSTHIARDITKRKLMEQEIQERSQQLGIVNEKLHTEIADHKRTQEEIEKANSQLEQAILNANEMASKAEAASHAKSDFLARMSHEIRTPMNAILGMAELLSGTDLIPEQQQYVSTFQSAGENLLGVINDILDISKVEAGHLELEKTDFDFRELLESLGDVMAVRAHGKSIELTQYIAPDVPTALIGDPTRLRQIFTNLIGNAIKFTAEGGILVEVKVSDDKSVETKPDEIELLCSVSDTGIGIGPAYLANMFQPFTQADASTTRKHGGTGLGLAIAKQLTELMEGRIWAESEVGHGTKFNFTVRFGVQNTKSTKRAQPPPLNLQGVRVLIVDDTATNRMILNKMVSELGARVVEAEDGEQGFAEYQRARLDSDPYRLVLLDCRMPGTDGFQMMEKIKGETRDRNTVIMMLTSDNRQGDITRAKEMGIDRYLIKPVKRQDLLASIADSLGRAKTTETLDSAKQKSEANAEFLEALRILLVEDNADNRLLVQSFLKKTPYQIDTAENGEIAVERFKATDYDLVLMDIQMPVMDGYTATGEIRKWEKAQGRDSTPIIALTAHAAREDELKSLQMGCTAHLTKPIKKAHLLDAILGYAHNTRKTEDKSGASPIDPAGKEDQGAGPVSELGKPL
ncbi:MAG: PAS domain S-box protein [Dehalococcoidia bacterium]|nr:PAS domain S-box protein [Dehalococcoidia bacterium]